MLSKLTEAAVLLNLWMPSSEMQSLADSLAGEEGDAFEVLIIETAERITNMPVTYEQDGKGDEAIVHLHYFLGQTDWWITEKDMTGDGRQQAFGFACLNGWTDCAELGYISIEDLIEVGAELDLYWTPKTLGEVRKALAAR